MLIRSVFMNIVVNGEPREVPEGVTILELLVILNLGDVPVAVERNEMIVTKDKHRSTHLVDGDVLEVVHFVGGG